MNTECLTCAICKLGPRHRKADHAIAILLDLNIMFAIPMVFDHRGPGSAPQAYATESLTQCYSLFKAEGRGGVRTKKFWRNRFLRRICS